MRKSVVASAIVVLAAVLVLGLGLAVGCSHYIPYLKSPNQPIELINSKNAKDPTWQQLQAFLVQDPTDEHFYSDLFYTCGNFAEELHNNAEAYGIKTAFVVVEFYSGAPHALNAFKTTDKGLVYIDVTSDEALFGSIGFSFPSLFGGTGQIALSDPDTKDKVAYIEIGKELGFISPQHTNGNLAYEYYQQSHTEIDDKLSAFATKLDQYNAKVEEYNTWVEEHAVYHELPATIFSESTPVLKEQDYEKAMAWKAELDEEWLPLEQEWEGLNGFLWQPMGKVKTVEIYW